MELRKAEAAKRLRGGLFKRCKRIPNYSRRFVFIRRGESDASAFSLVYRIGESDSEARREKLVPISSFKFVNVVDEMRYELEIDTSWRKHKYRFRAGTEAELSMWVDGLTLLMAP